MIVEVEDGENKDGAAEEQQEQAVEDQGYTLPCICVLQQDKVAELFLKGISQ